MAMNGRFHHMDIYVADLGLSVAFWGPFLEGLGFRKAADRATAKSWRSDAAELFFVQAEAEFVAAGYHRKRVGLNHLAFAVASREELERARDAVIASGARMLYGATIEETPTQHRFFFEDPDRIKVEVLAERR